MNFSGISSDSRLGAALRRPLKLLPPDAEVRVLQGPLRGKRWVAESSSHGCWLGSYEYHKQKLFARFVRPGDVVLDVGAHVGYYTLLSSVLTGPAGHVVAFEPFPANVAYLRRHMTLNSICNVDVVQAAVSDVSATANFASAACTSMGSLAPAGELSVRTVALDDFLPAHGAGRVDLVKIDVEGAEALVLSGARRLLETQRPIIFLALHGDEQRDACVDLLTAAGYRVDPLDTRSLMDASEITARPGI